MHPPTPEIHYAPGPRTRRRRLLGWVALAAVSGLLALVWLDRTAMEHVRFFLLQRRCLAYAPPPGRVIYDDDPQRIARLLQDPAYVGFHPAWVRKKSMAVYDNPLFQEYQRRTPVLSFRKFQPAVFMHRRTSPSGNQRLVVVRLSADVPGGWLIPQDGEPSRQPLIYSPYVESPATLTRRGTPFINYSSYPPALDMYVGDADRVRVLEGQPDPADASHFTIGYVHNDAAGTIDGWLNDDDTVTLAPRAGDVLELDPTYHWWSPTPGGLPGGGVTIGATGTHWTRDAAARPVRPKPRSPRN